MENTNRGNHWPRRAPPATHLLFLVPVLFLASACWEAEWHGRVPEGVSAGVSIACAASFVFTLLTTSLWVANQRDLLPDDSWLRIPGKVPAYLSILFLLLLIAVLVLPPWQGLEQVAP